MARARLQVAICGDGNPRTTYADAARTAGRLVAEAGAVLLTGGGAGVMLAAAEGARDAGGMVVSVLPDDAPASGVAPADARIATGAGEARNVILVRSADAVVAIGGGFGTLSEIAIARKLGIPVYGFATWNPTAPGDGGGLVENCGSVEEAVARALEAAGTEA